MTVPPPLQRRNTGMASAAQADTLDFIAPFIAMTEHDKVLDRLPDAQQLLATAGLFEKF